MIPDPSINSGSSRGSTGSPSRATSREATSRDDESFPKSEHLLKTKDFRRVYREGASFKSGTIVLRHLKNPLERNRIGFSMRSNVIRRASRRNRLRRLFKEAYRKNKQILKKGFDIVLVLRGDFNKTVSYKHIEESFLKLAKNAGLLA